MGRGPGVEERAGLTRDLLGPQRPREGTFTAGTQVHKLRRWCRPSTVGI